HHHRVADTELHGLGPEVDRAGVVAAAAPDGGEDEQCREVDQRTSHRHAPTTRPTGPVPDQRRASSSRPSDALGRPYARAIVAMWARYRAAIAGDEIRTWFSPLRWALA